MYGDSRCSFIIWKLAHTQIFLCFKYIWMWPLVMISGWFVYLVISLTIFPVWAVHLVCIVLFYCVCLFNAPASPQQQCTVFFSRLFITKQQSYFNAHISISSASRVQKCPSPFYCDILVGSLTVVCFVLCQITGPFYVSHQGFWNGKIELNDIW